MTLSAPPPLIQLHPDDNVAVCREAIAPGTAVHLRDRVLTVADRIDVGHKVALHDLRRGEKVLKYGAPIGSMTHDAPAGSHVHMDNMKSDYISSHTREASGGHHA